MEHAIYKIKKYTHIYIHTHIHTHTYTYMARNSGISEIVKMPGESLQTIWKLLQGQDFF